MKSLCVLILLLSSCSFKSQDSKNLQKNLLTIYEMKNDPSLDSDGDGISNLEETLNGTNPFVVNVPNLNLQFMKDFSLSFEANEKSQEIDSIKDIKLKKFDYLVGDLTISNIAKKTTAKFARFEGVNVGNFTSVDLTRINYPTISSSFISKLTSRSKNLNPINGSVTFSNTLKLERNKGFQQISNPVLNFYYLNHETNEYEILGQRKIEKNFYEGVTEKIDLTLDNLPSRLIQENLFQNGEFILAEIEDFEIPSLKTTYKKLMSKINENCIPITVTTPIETKVYYVALNNAHNHLGDFLKSLFGSNFKVENNKLVQISGLINNLSEIKNLSNLEGQTKVGKWFILVNNQLSDDVFQYEFHKNDSIILNYMTGDELSSQEFKKQSNFIESLTSEFMTKDFEIGDVGYNSEIYLDLTPRGLIKDSITEASWGYSDSGGNANWIYRYINKVSDDYSFSNEQILKRYSIVLNNKELSIYDLVKNKLAITSFDENKLNVVIKSISKTFQLTEDDTYKVFLRVLPENRQEDIGVWPTYVTGWSASAPGCATADAICKSWVNTIPVSSLCSNLDGKQGPSCNGHLKDEYRRKSVTLEQKLKFDLNYFLVNKYN